MALSTISLTAGMRANLFSLQQTSKNFEITQKRLSTGLRVNTALDDPINFFSAQEHKLRAGDLAGRKDGMSEAIQTIKAANVGVEGINNLIAHVLVVLVGEALALGVRAGASLDLLSAALQYGTAQNRVLDELRNCIQGLHARAGKNA